MEKYKNIFVVLCLILIGTMIILTGCPAPTTTPTPTPTPTPSWKTLYTDDFNRIDASGAACNWNNYSYKIDAYNQSLPSISSNKVVGNNMHYLIYNSPLNEKKIKLSGKFNASAFNTSAGFVIFSSDYSSVYMCLMSLRSGSTPTHKLMITKMTNFNDSSASNWVQTDLSNYYSFDLSAATDYLLEVTYNNTIITMTLMNVTGTVIQTVTNTDSTIVPYYYGFLVGNQSVNFTMDDFQIQKFE